MRVRAHVSRLAARGLLAGALAAVLVTRVGAQAPSPGARLPFGASAAVRVVVDTARDVTWLTPPPAVRVAAGSPASAPMPGPRPRDGVVEGNIASAVDRDSLVLQLFVPGDAARSTAAGATWYAAVPWDAVRTVERREDDARAIRSRGWRGALRGFGVGAVAGAAVATRQRGAGAVGGGLALGWLGFVLSAQGASVSAAPCWRLVYDRELAAERQRGGAPPHLGGEGPLRCPGRGR